MLSSPNCPETLVATLNKLISKELNRLRFSSSGKSESCSCAILVAKIPVLSASTKALSLVAFVASLRFPTVAQA